MQWAILDEPPSSLVRAPSGQNCMSTGFGGGPLFQRLRELEEEQERQERQLQELEKERATSQNLRRAMTYARQQFFTQGRLRRTGKKLGIRGRKDVCGDLITDSILFEIGELSDHEEFQRLYGVDAAGALTIKCASIIDAINKRASILAEDEKVWLADEDLEACFQMVLEFGRTASTAELEKFEEDETGTTDVAKAWFKIMNCPYPPPPKHAPCLNK